MLTEIIQALLRHIKLFIDIFRTLCSLCLNNPRNPRHIQKPAEHVR